MKLPVVEPSPIESLPELSRRYGANLLVKRDDLLPLVGGGNKVRKNIAIFAEIATRGVDSVVTCGGIQSNHARVVALLAARMGIECHLVLHSNDANKEKRLDGNYLLSSLSGARISIVSPDGISAEINRVVRTLSERGRTVMEIPGGAHSTLGAKAYADAVIELDIQLKERAIAPPDSIIVAVGTGATHAGLIAGVIRCNWRTRVIGISVARDRTRAWSVLSSMASELGISDTQLKANAEIRDDWVSGGYEVHSPQVDKTIRSAARTEGLILDPTYTGKAFLGMLSMFSTGELRPSSSVLFWHTGGLLNLLASEVRS